MDLLPPAVNRLIAIGCLAGIAAYFVWLVIGKSRRELGQNGWKVVLPSARLTLLQIVIGVVDLGFCALAMYLLMPTSPDIDFVSLAVVFILATLLGFASHAPGRIGVFDAAMLVALPQFGREELLATLVVFRILYFLIPFGISISIMGSREFWLSVVQPWLERRRLHGLGEACTASAVRQPARSARRRGRRRSFLLPPTTRSRGGEGSGVGVLHANSLTAVPADRPPTPDPSPPLRGGREKKEANDNSDVIPSVFGSLISALPLASNAPWFEFISAS